jgi:hypothetical protein
MKHTLSAAAAAVIALATLAACGDATPAATAAEPVVRDSAGITIVENQAPAWPQGQGLRLVGQPALEIGMMDGPDAYQLHQLVDARRLADGAIAVANAGSHEIRIYGADGRHLRSLGGQGGGPGEFSMLSTLMVAEDDTLHAFDMGQQRLSIFHPTAGFVRAEPLPNGGGPPAGGSVVRRGGSVGGPGGGALGRLSDGSYVLAGRQGGFGPGNLPGDSEGISRDSMTYLRWDPAAGETGTVRPFLGAERVVRTSSPGEGRVMVSMVRAPFMRGSYGAVAGDRLYHGDAERREIEVLDLAGEGRWSIRWPGEPEPVSERYLDAVREERRRAMEADGATGTGGDPFEGVPRPPSLPAYSAIRTGNDGSLWVQRFGWPGDDEAVWDVFDREGRWLSEVATPRRFRITEIGEGYVIGVYQDDLDVEYVRMYELIGPQA